MAYLLDTDVFIAAKNLHYGMDFCPAFWDWLVLANAEARVFSIERVVEELGEVDDDLRNWARGRGDGFFLEADETALPALGRIAEWVNAHPRYSPAAKATFLDAADYYLIAQALAGGHTLVTHEKPENSIHRVKIPSVCLALKIPFSSPWDMLRRERARFVLPEGVQVA